MIIHVYSIMRNEEDLLPYFLRHYSTFADTIFILNKNLKKVLEEQKKRGIKAIKATGFTMYSENFPQTQGQIYEECFWGSRTHLYDKTVVFDPEIDIKFTGGRHKTILPPGVAYTRSKIFLL